MSSESLAAVHLGQKSEYKTEYDPSLLVFYPRKIKRDEIGVGDVPPFYGFDVWNLYEISYLLPTGFPQVKIGRLIYSSNTENIVESKSLKLYFNSFNNTVMEGDKELAAVVMRDLKAGLKGTAPDVENYFSFKLYDTYYRDSENLIPFSFYEENPKDFRYIDQLAKTSTQKIGFNLNPQILSEGVLTRNPWDDFNVVLRSDLLKSNCLVTHQPDWGTALISFKDWTTRPSELSILRYITSFRNHNEFHEQCCERIFTDISKYTTGGVFGVRCHYTRRGGIDINPVRVDNQGIADSYFHLYEEFNQREPRQ